MDKNETQLAAARKFLNLAWGEIGAERERLVMGCLNLLLEYLEAQAATPPAESPDGSPITARATTDSPSAVQERASIPPPTSPSRPLDQTDMPSGPAELDFAYVHKHLYNLANPVGWSVVSKPGMRVKVKCRGCDVSTWFELTPVQAAREPSSTSQKPATPSSAEFLQAAGSGSAYRRISDDSDQEKLDKPNPAWRLRVC